MKVRSGAGRGALPGRAQGKAGVADWLARRWRLLLGLATIVLPGLMYAGLLGAPFVYDDLDQVVGNPWLLTGRGLIRRFVERPVALSSSFRGVGGLTYRPVFWCSLALDRWVWGLNAGGFHATNLVLHMANGVLLFLLVRKLGASMRLGWVTALLWVLLPVNVEVVGWVSGRSYSLCLALLLGGLLCALRFAERRSGWMLAGFAGCCALAPLANEVGFFILPLTGLVLWFRGAERRREALLVGVAGVFAATELLVRHWMGVRLQIMPGAWRLVGVEFWQYVGWLVAPVYMSVERSTSVPVSVGLWAALLGWIGLIALCGFGFVRQERTRWVRFGLLWVAVGLLPFCGLVFVYQGMAERFVYVASVGLAIAVSSALAAMPGKQRMILGVLVAGWAVWGVWRGAERVRDWDEPAALYRHSLEANPESPSLWFNLGFTLKQAGDYAGAERAFLRVIELRPAYPEVDASLGDVYLAEGDLAGAQRMYAAALRQEPGSYETLLNSATAFQRQGALAEAERQDRRAIAVAPGESAAYTNLGALYSQEGRDGEAEAMFSEAIRARPDDASPLFDLAVMYQKAGRDAEARALYARVLALKPGDADTLANLGGLR